MRRRPHADAKEMRCRYRQWLGRRRISDEAIDRMRINVRRLAQAI